jgi:RimJ/RimL family protein N-acetyltransferase
MPTKFSTDRLDLRLWTERDVDWHHHLITERGQPMPTEKQEHAIIAAACAAWAESGISTYVLSRQVDDEVIGSLGEPEIAYELFRRFHGNGYATEAARVIVEAAAATGRARLWSTVRAWNTPSFRVLEKLGFRRDHTVTDERGELVWNVKDLSVDPGGLLSKP